MVKCYTRDTLETCAMETLGRVANRRATPFGINAALALAAVAGGILLPQYLGTLAGRLLAMQFLVVHAVMMLYVVAWWQRRARDRGESSIARFLTGVMWFLYAMYPLSAWSLGGPFGLLEFAVLAGGTFLGAWHESHGRRELMQIGVRWAVAFVALAVVMNAFSLPKRVEHWPGRYGSIGAAGVYFGALAAAEALPRFYGRLVVWMRWLILRLRRLEARSKGSKGQ